MYLMPIHFGPMCGPRQGPIPEHPAAASRSTIYLRMSEGSFPNHISLGSRAVGWLRTEVADWMNQRIHESRGSEYVLKNRT